MNSRLRIPACILVLVTLLTNCAFGYVPERNFWEERRLSMPSSRHVFSRDPVDNRDPGLKSAIGRIRQGEHSGETALTTDLLSPFGSIRRILKPTGNPKGTVVHIQDVHRNVEAQTNIAKAVQKLLSENKAGVVALEGAFARIDLTRFQTFPNRDAVRMVADYLLREKELSGPMHAALTNRAEIIGVDDEPHYNANVQAVRSAAPLAASLKQTLSKEKAALAAKKRITYNAALLSFADDVDRFKDKQISLADYARLLVAQTKMEPVNIKLFTDALDAEARFDFARLEKERAAFLAQRNPSLEKFPGLSAYARYTKMTQQLDIEKIFGEIAQLEEAAFAMLAKTDAEKQLLAESKRIYLTGKLLNFALTKEEWLEYRRGGPPRPPELTVTAESGRPRGRPLRVFEDFYVEADIRDAKMAENFLKAAPPRTSVLVTGGFHSSGIDKKLTDAGYTVVQFVPKISKVDAANGSEYLSEFTQNKTPLSKLFEGEKLFLSPLQTEPLTKATLMTVTLDAEPQRALETLSPDTTLVAMEESALTVTFKGKQTGVAQTIQLIVADGKIVAAIEPHLAEREISSLSTALDFSDQSTIKKIKSTIAAIVCATHADPFFLSDIFLVILPFLYSGSHFNFPYALDELSNQLDQIESIQAERVSPLLQTIVNADVLPHVEHWVTRALTRALMKTKGLSPELAQAIRERVFKAVRTASSKEAVSILDDLASVFRTPLGADPDLIEALGKEIEKRGPASDQKEEVAKVNAIITAAVALSKERKQLAEEMVNRVAQNGLVYPLAKAVIHSKQPDAELLQPIVKNLVSVLEKQPIEPQTARDVATAVDFAFRESKEIISSHAMDALIPALFDATNRNNLGAPGPGLLAAVSKYSLPMTVLERIRDASLQRLVKEGTQGWERWIIAVLRYSGPLPPSFSKTYIDYFHAKSKNTDTKELTDGLYLVLQKTAAADSAYFVPLIHDLDSLSWRIYTTFDMHTEMTTRRHLFHKDPLFDDPDEKLVEKDFKPGKVSPDTPRYDERVTSVVACAIAVLARTDGWESDEGRRIFKQLKRPTIPVLTSTMEGLAIGFTEASKIPAEYAEFTRARFRELSKVKGVMPLSAYPIWVRAAVLAALKSPLKKENWNALLLDFSDYFSSDNQAVINSVLQGTMEAFAAMPESPVEELQSFISLAEANKLSVILPKKLSPEAEPLNSTPAPNHLRSLLEAVSAPDKPGTKALEFIREKFAEKIGRAPTVQEISLLSTALDAYQESPHQAVTRFERLLERYRKVVDLIGDANKDVGEEEPAYDPTLIAADSLSAGVTDGWDEAFQLLAENLSPDSRSRLTSYLSIKEIVLMSILEKKPLTDGHRPHFKNIVGGLQAMNEKTENKTFGQELMAGAALFGEDGPRLLMQYARKERNANLLFFNDNHQKIWPLVEKIYSSFSAGEKKLFRDNILPQISGDNSVDGVGNRSQAQFCRLITMLNQIPGESWRATLATHDYGNPSRNEMRDRYVGPATRMLRGWKHFKVLLKLTFLRSQKRLTQKIDKYMDGTPEGERKYNYFEWLILHPGITDLSAIEQFIENPAAFFDRKDVNTNERLHSEKKASRYFEFPFIDLKPVELRDGLILGQLDDAQVYKAFSQEFIPGLDFNRLESLNPLDLVRALLAEKNLDRDSLRMVLKQRITAAKSKLKGIALISAQSIETWLDSDGFSAKPSLPPIVERALNNSRFRFKDLLAAGLTFKIPTYSVRIIPKSDPQAAVTGNEAPSCMGFGTGKNTIYLLNPVWGFLAITVPSTDEEGNPVNKILATSVISADRNIRQSVNDLVKKLQTQKPEQLADTHLHEFLGDRFLDEISKDVKPAADNVEGARDAAFGNGKKAAFEKNVKDAYRQLMIGYTREHPTTPRGRAFDRSKMLIGLGYADFLTTFIEGDDTYVKQENETIPGAPAPYSDKTGAMVGALKLDGEQPKVPPLNGVSPLSVEDSLEVAYIESKLYKGISYRNNLAGVQNELIAATYNEAIKGESRKNFSLAYFDNGKLVGYLIAYAGFNAQTKEEAVYMSDFAILPEYRNTRADLILKQFIRNVRAFAEKRAADGKETTLLFEARNSDDGSYRLFGLTPNEKATIAPAAQATLLEARRARMAKMGFEILSEGIPDGDRVPVRMRVHAPKSEALTLKRTRLWATVFSLGLSWIFWRNDNTFVDLFSAVAESAIHHLPNFVSRHENPTPEQRIGARYIRMKQAAWRQWVFERLPFALPLRIGWWLGGVVAHARYNLIARRRRKLGFDGWQALTLGKKRVTFEAKFGDELKPFLEYSLGIKSIRKTKAALKKISEWIQTDPRELTLIKVFDNKNNLWQLYFFTVEKTPAPRITFFNLGPDKLMFKEGLMHVFDSTFHMRMSDFLFSQGNRSSVSVKSDFVELDVPNLTVARHAFNLLEPHSETTARSIFRTEDLIQVRDPNGKFRIIPRLRHAGNALAEERHPAVARPTADEIITALANTDIFEAPLNVIKPAEQMELLDQVRLAISAGASDQMNFLFFLRILDSLSGQGNAQEKLAHQLKRLRPSTFVDVDAELLTQIFQSIMAGVFARELRDDLMELPRKIIDRAPAFFAEAMGTEQLSAMLSATRHNRHGHRWRKTWSAVAPDAMTLERIPKNAALLYPNMSRDGRYLAQKMGNDLVVWNRFADYAFFVLQGHKEKINTFAFSPDGRRVVTGSVDHTVRVWNLETGKQQGATFSDPQFLNANALAFHPTAPNVVALANNEGHLLFIRDGNAVKPVGQEKHGIVTALSFSPDGKYLIETSNIGVFIWNVESVPTLVREYDHAHSAAFSSDGRHLVVSGSFARVVEWPEDRTIAHREISSAGAAQAVAFSPDGSEISFLRQGGDIDDWAWKKGGHHTRPGVTSGNPHVFFSFNNDSMLSRTAVNDVFRVWDLNTEKPVGPPIYINPFLALTNHRNGENLMFLGASAIIMAINWNTAETVNKAISLPERASMAAWSPDGEYVAWATANQTIKVWNWGQREQVGLEFPLSDAVKLTFSSDGKLLAVARKQGRLTIWNWRTGERTDYTIGMPNATALALSADTRLCAIADDSRHVSIWDLSNRKRVGYIELMQPANDQRVPMALSFSRDGKFLMIGDGENPIEIWDSALKKLLTLLPSLPFDARRLSNLRRYEGLLATPAPTLTMAGTRDLAAWLGLGRNSWFTVVVFAPLVESIVHWIPWFPLMHENYSHHQWIGVLMIWSFGFLLPYLFPVDFNMWGGGLIGHAVYNQLARLLKLNTLTLGTHSPSQDWLRLSKLNADGVLPNKNIVLPLSSASAEQLDYARFMRLLMNASEKGARQKLYLACDANVAPQLERQLNDPSIEIRISSEKLIDNKRISEKGLTTALASVDTSNAVLILPPDIENIDALTALKIEIRRLSEFVPVGKVGWEKAIHALLAAWIAA